MKTLLLCGVVLLATVFPAAALTNVYSTNFEKAEGYDATYELVGQKGWVTDSASYGGNGLLTNFLGVAGNQAAYLGLWPLEPAAASFTVWQPLNYQPLVTALTTVKFSTTMTFVDSTNGKRDDFYWSVFNAQSQRLFTLDFFNEDLRIYYILDGTNTFTYTGAIFTNDVVYALVITMDLARNRWSATLNGTNIVGGQPMTTTGAHLDLGDVDAVWSLASTTAPGDNFMVFDNYLVTAEADVPVRLSSLGRAANGQFLLRLSGPSNFRYAIEASTNLAQWTALKTNMVTDGSFDFIDSGAATLSKRLYRARLVP